MGEYRRISDEELVEACRLNKLPADITISDLADTVLRARRTLRHDSHRAGELKKLRYKMDNFSAEFVGRLMKLVEDTETDAITTEKIATWLESAGAGGKELAAMVREGRWR